VLRGIDGKVAIVTGGGRGIGAAVCRRLAEEGARVAVVDIDCREAEEVASSLPAGRAIAVVADVSTVEGAELYLDSTVKAFGRVDFLHNNAGIAAHRGHVADLDVAAFDEVIGVNVRGAFLGLQVVMRQLRSQGTGGAIVNMSSTAALRARAGMSAYTASKQAVIGLTKCAALEGAPAGIRVNAICPGVIKTRLVPSADAGDGVVRVAELGIEEVIPIGRFGQPAELAAMVAWLMSDESSFVVGCILTADGGWTA
jgi:3-oxoacyl-[acyl-carrier protein] reductase